MHDRKTLTFRVKDVLTASECTLSLSDVPHPFPAILNVVETRHSDHSQVVDSRGSPSSI